MYEFVLNGIWECWFEFYYIISGWKVWGEAVSLLWARRMHQWEFAVWLQDRLSQWKRRRWQYLRWVISSLNSVSLLGSVLLELQSMIRLCIVNSCLVSVCMIRAQWMHLISINFLQTNSLILLMVTKLSWVHVTLWVSIHFSSLVAWNMIKYPRNLRLLSDSSLWCRLRSSCESVYTYLLHLPMCTCIMLIHVFSSEFCMFKDALVE